MMNRLRTALTDANIELVALQWTVKDTALALARHGLGGFNAAGLDNATREDMILRAAAAIQKRRAVSV